MFCSREMPKRHVPVYLQTLFFCIEGSSKDFVFSSKMTMVFVALCKRVSVHLRVRVMYTYTCVCVCMLCVCVCVCTCVYVCVRVYVRVYV